MKADGMPKMGPSMRIKGMTPKDFNECMTLCWDVRSVLYVQFDRLKFAHEYLKYDSVDRNEERGHVVNALNYIDCIIGALDSLFVEIDQW